MSIMEKLNAICTRVYHADGVQLVGNAVKQIKQLEELGFGKLPICMAKTQYSFSDDASLLGAPSGFTVTVRNLKVCAGRGLHRGADRRHHDHAGAAEGAGRRKDRRRRKRRHLGPVLMARILKGAPVAEALDRGTAHAAAELARRGIRPALGILRVGERADDLAYEAAAVRRCEKLGVAVRCVNLPADVKQGALIAAIARMNSDALIHGVLMFRPLPPQLDEAAACGALH